MINTYFSDTEAVEACICRLNVLNFVLVFYFVMSCDCQLIIKENVDDDDDDDDDDDVMN